MTERRGNGIVTSVKRSKTVGINTKITDYGAKEEDFEMLAEKAMNDPCKPGNPREVTKEDFIELYRRAAQ